MKLTKGSFFIIFKSKDELGVDLLKRYCASSKEAFLMGCCQGQEDPLKRIYGFLDFMIEMGKKNAKKGCLLGHMSQELSDTHPDIRSICCRSFREMAEVLRDMILRKPRRNMRPAQPLIPKASPNILSLCLKGRCLLRRLCQKRPAREVV